MANPSVPAPFQITSGELAAALGAELVGSPSVRITGARGIEAAQPSDLTFIRSPQFAAAWAGSRAGAAVVTRGVEVPGHDPANRALIVVPSADLAMAKLLEQIAPRPVRPEPGVHPSAVVDASSRIAPDARIGALCVIGAGTLIEAGAVLHPRVTLGAGVRIGANVELFPGVVVYDRCEIRARSILHANTVIGADGFGFVPDPSTGGVTKVVHAGIVRIGTGVEIGANSCIDRAKFDATVIGDGTKIDNLVQIAHNCVIGRGCVICGVTGIAGSVKMGDGVTIGGSCGIADAIQIGARATLGGGSGLMRDLPAGEAWLGYPAAPGRAQLRTWSAVRELPELLRALKKIVSGGGGPSNSKS
jgi:UDP-3-O-[3-hydroxymyristoyl] glucosamine N-acyltransferase